MFVCSGALFARSGAFRGAPWHTPCTLAGLNQNLSSYARFPVPLPRRLAAGRPLLVAAACGRGHSLPHRRGRLRLPGAELRRHGRAFRLADAPNGGGRDDCCGAQHPLCDRPRMDARLGRHRDCPGPHPGLQRGPLLGDAPRRPGLLAPHARLQRRGAGRRHARRGHPRRRMDHPLRHPVAALRAGHSLPAAGLRLDGRRGLGGPFAAAGRRLGRTARPAAPHGAWCGPQADLTAASFWNEKTGRPPLVAGAAVPLAYAGAPVIRSPRGRVRTCESASKFRGRGCRGT